MKIWGSSYSHVMGRIRKGKDGPGSSRDGSTSRELLKFPKVSGWFYWMFCNGRRQLHHVWTLAYTSTVFRTETRNIQVSEARPGLGSVTSACLNLGPAPGRGCNTVYKEKTKQGTALRHDRNVFLLEGAPKKSSEGQNKDKCWGKAAS